MKRTTSLWLPILAALAPACVAESGAPDPPTECREANVITWNGTEPNGVMLNGIMLNAWNNGTALDGAGLVQGVAVEDAIVEALATDDPDDHVVGQTLEAVTVDGDSHPLTIASVAREGGLAYLELSLADGRNVCGPGGRGLIVEGVWDLVTGDRHDTMHVGDHPLHRSFSCSAGVIAKCVRWGYDPAEIGAELHQTCTRMARADYCGDGIPHTDNGTPIDVFDALGLVEAEGGMDFEAGWGPDGAVCVSHPRYLDVVVGEGPAYPSCWNDLPRCGDGEQAEQHGALIMNASTARERTWCSADDLPDNR